VTDLFVWNLFSVFGGLSPVLALLLARLPFLNGKKWFLASQVCFAALIVYMSVFFPIIKGETLPIILVLYSIFLFAFNIIFYRRFGTKNFSKSLALSIMLTFVLTEMQEIPVFFVGYSSLKFLESPYTLFCALAPIYPLVVWFLASKIAQLHLSKVGFLFLFVGISFLFPLYLLQPQLDLSLNPSPLAFAKRFWCFFLLATTFWRWSELNYESA